MAKPKRRRKPELKVVFDSNSIFTDAAAFLFKREVSDLIRANFSHPDLNIRWYLPDVVRCEREYQMCENGFALLSSIEKIERVLGHNLNITTSTITDRVRSLIDEQLRELNAQVLTLDASIVDWPRVVRDAAYRVPPFQKGEKEKGFRDAVILESFLQLVHASPRTPRFCRVVLVTDDRVLRAAAKERTTGAKNVRILANVVELKGLINTLGARIDEAFVRNIEDTAAKYFFDKENDNSLYYRQRIAERIRERFSKELALLPAGMDGKEPQTTWITPPRFSKKEGQRIYWVSRISFEYKPYRFETKLQPPPPALGPQHLFATQTAFPPPTGYSGFNPQSAVSPVDYLSLLSSQPSGTNVAGTTAATREKIYGKNGQIIFDVTWSAAVTTHRHNFSSPKIESIDFVEAAW